MFLFFSNFPSSGRGLSSSRVFVYNKEKICSYPVNFQLRFSSKTIFCCVSWFGYLVVSSDKRVQSLSFSLSIIYPHACLNHHNSSFFILAPSVTPFTFLCFYCFSPPPIYLNPPLKLRSRATNFPQALTENDYRERRTVITMYAPSGSVLPCAQEQFFAV